jgi:hypothetical protein
MFFLKKSLDHTLLKWFTWFISHTTQRYIIQCPQLSDCTLSLTHSLTYYLLHMLFSCFPLIPHILTSCLTHLLTALSELSFYIRSDDVMLPEPSELRSFSHFPRCTQSRECSGSFFTWAGGMSNWYAKPAIVGLFQVAVALSKHSWLPILRMVTVKLSKSRS